MKIERINENQIRCTLTSFDLSVRNMNLGELAYGSEKARSLFREMIQKASNEVGFDAEDIPLMVEAIPLSNESVMLVITKIEDPEELDTRFSKFSPLSEDEQEGLYNSITSEFLEGADGLMEFLKNDLLGLSSGQTDSAPAKESGAAASAAFAGETGRMISLKRISDYPYQCITESVDVQQVANLEKKVPLDWISPDGMQVTAAFEEYARPLILDEVTPVYVNGTPRHIRL